MGLEKSSPRKRFVEGFEFLTAAVTSYPKLNGLKLHKFTLL